MARKNAMDKVSEIGKESNDKAEVLSIVWVADNDLLDFPSNNEDLSHTEDLELSINQQGFTDPLEITDFGCENGKYMIVSGHRRRMAGRRVGKKDFPCIIRHFKDEAEVMNYVLLSNAQRNIDSDPLMYARRYMGHEQYLKKIGFKGSVREEIAKRMSLKVAQADRYNALNKVIVPIQNLILSGSVGMSSVTDTGVANSTPEAQSEILVIMNEALGNGVELTRPLMKEIVKKYREGKRSWLEVIQIEMSEDEATTEADYMNPPVEEVADPFRRDELNKDGFEENTDKTSDNDFESERPTAEDYEAIEKASETEKKKRNEMTEEEREAYDRAEAGKKIIRSANMFGEGTGAFYTFENEKEGFACIISMAKSALDELLGNVNDDKYEDDVRELIANGLKELKENYLSEIE